MKIRMRLFATLVVVCLSSICASAAVYTVTNTNHDGAGSLRESVGAANSTPDDDTINFNIPGCESGGCTILFSGTNGTTALGIDAAGKLTIANSPTASNIVINANDTDRVFIVTESANLTLSGIAVVGGNSLRNADSPFNGGGGIYNRGGAVTLINSTVAGNSASGAQNATGAGGITNLGNLTLINSTVSDNNGTTAGIFNAGTTELTNSNVRNNNGLGIYCDGGSLTANGTTISGNRTAIVNQSTMSLINSTISGHTTVDSPSIANFGMLTLTSSTVKDNAQGISHTGSNPIQLKVIDSIIEQNGNSKYSYGGAIFSDGEFADVNIINSTISGNTGILAGGICVMSGSLTSINSTITKNIGSGAIAGGIFNNGSFSLRNTIVADNTTPGDSPDIGNPGSAISKGNNLIGYSPNTNTAWQSSDILDQSPRLAPLGNYGGATQTFALTNLSPGINAGNNCVNTINGCGDNNPAIPTDARGAVRVGSVDIGAFELNNTSNGGTFRAVTSGGRMTLPFSYLLTSDSGAFTYSVTAGSLPPGLFLTNTPPPLKSSRLSGKSAFFVPQAGSYAITGTPTMGGTFNYTITATDGTNSVSTDYQTTIAAAPTAASVDISGRVLSGVNGFGVSNARVLLSDQNGRSRMARTNPFGAFSFPDVPVGGTYVVSVSAKRYRFVPKIITAFDSVEDLTISAEDSFPFNSSFSKSGLSRRRETTILD